MKILALEFSSPQRSAAVLCAPAGAGRADLPVGRAAPRRAATGFNRGGDPIEIRSALIEGEAVDAGSGATRALALVAEALRAAKLEREQIECLAVGLGPGSYTGIRAAIALAQGWQLASGARGLKLLGLSSADVLARQAQSENLFGQISIVIDAQRNEFYLARYEVAPDRCQLLEPLRLAGAEAVRRREAAGDLLVGPEVGRWFPRGREIFPRAAALARLALERNDFVAGEKLEPIYLRETRFVKAPPPRGAG